MKFDSVIFDLDGTLWDATSIFPASWNTVYEKYPIFRRPLPTIADYKNVMGLEPAPLMKKLFPYLEWEQVKDFWAEACAAEDIYLQQHGAVLYDRLEEMLALLNKQVKLFVVSNCNDGYIQAFFSAHGLHNYFTDFECAGRTGLSKAENIRLVAERNHLNAPVYVGDTVWDYEAACGAGVPFIHAAYGFGQVAAVPAITSPMELPALIFDEQE